MPRRKSKYKTLDEQLLEDAGKSSVKTLDQLLLEDAKKWRDPDRFKTTDQLILEDLNKQGKSPIHAVISRDELRSRQRALDALIQAEKAARMRQKG